MAEKDTESLFDELIGEATSSEVEELISNPFDEKTTRDELTSVQKDLLDAQMLSKRQITNSKLIDRLPEHRQKQAKDLASQIDETR